MFSLLFLFLFRHWCSRKFPLHCHWCSRKFPLQVCLLEWLCACCIRCTARESGQQVPEGPGEWELLCSASQRGWSSQLVCHAGTSRGLLKCHQLCCYVFDKNKNFQGTGALLNVCVRQNMGFNSSPKLGTRKHTLMLQTSFSFIIHCNKQDCTCHCDHLLSICLVMCVKVVLCFDHQGILHEHCKCILTSVFQSAGGHRRKKQLKWLSVGVVVVTAEIILGPHWKRTP